MDLELSIAPRAELVPTFDLADFDEVTVRVYSAPAARREAEMFVIYKALDQESHRIYTRLRDGLGFEPSRPVEATRFLARAKFRRIEGVRQPEDPSAWRRFIDTPVGFYVADASIPAYLEDQVPDDDELQMVGRAARICIKQGEGKDPYLRTKHEPECERDIWEDEDEQALISRKELNARKCTGCFSEYELWLLVLKETGDVRYGQAALRALALEHQQQLVGASPNLTLREFEHLRVVNNEQRKRQIALQQRAERDAKSRSAGKGKP